VARDVTSLVLAHAFDREQQNRQEEKVKLRAYSVLGILIVVLMLLAMPASASGNVLRVGPGQEYETIQAAVDAAKQGSTILVYPDPDWYTETVSVTKDKLKIIAQGDGVIVEPPGRPAGFHVHADHVTIRGFDIEYGADCAQAIAFEGSHNTFAENYIHLAAACYGVSALVCIDPDGGSDYNTVEYNTIDEADWGIVIHAETDDAINRGNIIRDNTLLDIGAEAIAIENGRGFLVSGNRIEVAGQGTSIDVVADNGVAQGHHRIVTNTIGPSFASGIQLHAYPGTVLTHNRISDNTIQICGDDCLALEADSGAVLSHNHVISNTVGLSLANGVHLSAEGDGAVSDNLILGNLVYHNAQDGISLSSGADHNRILNNEAQTNNEVGIAVAGDSNLIVGNWAWNNTVDLEDTGVGNKWRNNTLGD
jgi:parallel beta-helix repeat protein